MSSLETISFKLIIFLLVLGCLTMAFFKILTTFILPAVHNRRLKRIFKKWSYRLEVLTWVSILSYAIYRLLLESPEITLVFLVILGCLGWNFWKDTIHGIIFRLDDKVKPGDTISILEEKGVIEKIGIRNLILRTTLGEQMVVPFQKINGYRIITEEGRENIVSFQISTQEIERFGGNKELKKLIMSWPWTTPNHEPKIEKAGENNWEISAWVISPDPEEKIKEYVINAIRQKP